MVASRHPTYGSSARQSYQELRQSYQELSGFIGVFCLLLLLLQQQALYVRFRPYVVALPLCFCLVVASCASLPLGQTRFLAATAGEVLHSAGITREPAGLSHHPTHSMCFFYSCFRLSLLTFPLLCRRTEAPLQMDRWGTSVRRRLPSGRLQRDHSAVPSRVFRAEPSGASAEIIASAVRKSSEKARTPAVLAFKKEFLCLVGGNMGTYVLHMNMDR